LSLNYRRYKLKVAKTANVNDVQTVDIKKMARASQKTSGGFEKKSI